MKFFINADMSSRVTSLGLAAFLVFAIPVAGSAQQTPIPNPAATVSPETAKSFDPAAETQMWLGTVPADKRAKSDAYFEGGYWLVLWNFLLTVAISIFLLASRISARLRDFDRTLFARVAIEVDEKPRVLPSRDGVHLKNRFRRALGVE